MGRRRGTPVGRRRPLRDPQHHHVLRRPLHRQHQRGVRQVRPGRPRRATRRSRRQPHHPDQAELPGRVPDGGERALRRDRARRLAGDPVAGVPDQPDGIRAVRRGGGHALHVPGGRGVIVGFYGRSGWQLDAVGLYVAPLRPERMSDRVQKLGLLAYRAVMQRIGPQQPQQQHEQAKQLNGNAQN